MEVPNLCLIYHVFNTLTPRHLDLSLESLAKQDFNWRSLVVFNSSTDPKLSDEAIGERLVKYNLIDRFEEMHIAEKRPDAPPTITADFLSQFETISGHEGYLVLKGDFYLGAGVIEAVEEKFPNFPQELLGASVVTVPSFANFKKFDLREYVTDDRIRELGEHPTYTSLMENVPTAEPWESGMWKVECEAVGYDGLDGVMHAYNDAARWLAAAPPEEVTRSWGYCSIFDHMVAKGAERIIDDRLYALHVYHEVPAKTGPEPRMRMGYRY